MSMKQLFTISGKVAIVTGGSQGIGAMIARGFVENGVRTYITARTVDKCEAMAKELSQWGECIAMPCDLSRVEGIERLVKEVSEREERLDILVNNAGVSPGVALEEFSEEDWDKTLSTNTKAPFFLVQKFLPLLKKSATPDDPARIINIASITGMRTPKGHLGYSYSTSKGAVITLTAHLAINLAEENITVNAVSPGLFPSGMTDGWIDDVVEKYPGIVPLGRVGKAGDIAGAAIYLASPAAAWMTGVNIPVDGGAVIRR